MIIEAGKVVAFRPTEYDVSVLKQIAKAHPELPDTGDLVRKALREYEISREPGGKTAKINDIWQMMRLWLASQHITYVSTMDGAKFSRGEYGDCDNPPVSE